MTIIFIGNFDGATYTTENHHKKTYEKLGHTVIPLQENRSSCEELHNAFKSVKINEPVAICWTHTHSFKFDEGYKIVGMLAYYKQIGVPTYGYHLDLWMGLHRQKDLYTDPYWLIQHFFTVDKLMADWLNENTKVQGHFLPAGVFEDEAYMAEPNHEKYPHEIIFTGAKHYHSEWSYRTKLIDWLHSTYGNRFAHFGSGGLPNLREHELNVLYASAKITVGDSLCINFDYPYYSSDRYWESMGRGAFLIYPKISGLELYCTDKKEVVYYKFDDFVQLKKLIDHYLEANEERETIRKAGHERVKAIGTYTHRLKQLLETLEKEK